MFVDADARSKWGRRFRDLVAIYADHVGGNPTPPQISLIRRIATLDVETERMEGTLASGGTINHDVYNRMVGNLRRSLEELGFHAKPSRSKGPSLTDIAARRSA